jgi:cardiolipin synthase
MVQSTGATLATCARGQPWTSEGQMQTQWIFAYFLPSLGFLLALVLLVQLVRQRRPPSNTMAWLLAIVLAPYVGVPLYLMLGGRKMRRAAELKEDLLTVARRTGPSPAGQAQELPLTDGEAFPRREGNRLSVLGTGEGAYEGLIRSIESARESIHISTYILGVDDTGRAIVDALARKAAQGVKVYLLLDAVGCWPVRGHFLRELTAAGGRHAYFMPMLHLPFHGRANLRNHRKMLIFDHARAIVGGMNLASEYMGKTSDPKRWHDLSLTVEGPVVADLYTIFRGDWAFAAKEELPHAPAAPAPVSGGDAVPIQLIPSGPDTPGDTLYDAVVTSLFGARSRVWIVTPYFVPDEMLTKSICIAARRGVDVRIVVPRVSNHPAADLVRRSYLRQVQEAGCTVHCFRPGMLHAKVIVVDERLAVVGSMNMDVRSFFLNYEVALFMYSRDIAGQLTAWVEDLMAKSDIGLREAHVAVEFLEGLGRLLAPLL